LNSRFALHNYAGQPTRFFFVNEAPLDTDASTPAKEVSHHIILVDRSGSMYRDLPDLKSTLLKLLTLEEYRNEEMKVSLISYSSAGDMTTHFNRVAVEDVMRSGSAEQESIKQLRVTGLTCISQALAKARELVRDGELTCVTLHSDGFANDRTPTSEARAVLGLASEFAGMSNVFVNTIAYSRWSDFKLLSSIANQCSGICVQALRIKDVYNALVKTADLLAGQVTPATAVPVGGAAYQIFLSRQGRKINGSTSDLVVKGAKPGDDRVVYQYHEATEAEYNASTLPVCGESCSSTPIYAYSRCQLAEGNLNTSKYALISTRNTTLINGHAKALTNEELAAMAAGIDGVLFDMHAEVCGAEYGLDTSQASVLTLVNVLGQHARDLQVDLGHLRSHYNKRSVRRIPGKRLDDGTVETPWVKTAYQDDNAWVQVQAFELNRNTATINMRVARPVNLVEAETDTLIPEVAGVSLDKLSSYNNYTIVGDGALNLTAMQVQISSKKAFRALADLGVLSGDYDPTTVYTIDFGGRPLVDYVQSFNPDAIQGVFTELAGLKVLDSIFSALSRGTSEHYTAEQVAELKRHYLSPALYFSPPTTNEYADLKVALAEGSVDTRLSYKVDIGDTEILGLGKLHSANKFLDRMFTITLDGELQKKPTMGLLWESEVAVDYKALSARIKLTAVDDFMKPIFEDFLALDPNGRVKEILTSAGVGELADKIAAWRAGRLGQDATVEVFTEAKAAVNKRMEDVFAGKIRPLVFFIGSTGLVPDDFNTKALPADALMERHPLLSLSKAEKEGTFFQVGDAVLSVYVKGEHFSTGQGAPASAK
jgi:Mg-chelatase subunit ChlD